MANILCHRGGFIAQTTITSLAPFLFVVTSRPIRVVPSRFTCPSDVCMSKTPTPRFAQANLGLAGWAKPFQCF
jgi:hypothetical protein